VTKPTPCQHSQLPPLAENAKDGAPTVLVMLQDQKPGPPRLFIELGKLTAAGMSTTHMSKLGSYVLLDADCVVSGARELNQAQVPKNL